MIVPDADFPDTAVFFPPVPCLSAGSPSERVMEALERYLPAGGSWHDVAHRAGLSMAEALEGTLWLLRARRVRLDEMRRGSADVVLIRRVA